LNTDNTNTITYTTTTTRKVLPRVTFCVTVDDTNSNKVTVFIDW
jgi:hypothetical protein